MVIYQYKSRMGNQPSNCRHSVRIEMGYLPSKIYEEEEEEEVEEVEQGMEEEEFENEGKFQDGKARLISENEAKNFPFNCIGVLFFRARDRLGHGTGILIAPDLVLTSAHNICQFHENQRQDFVDLIFYPGLSGRAKKGHCSGEKDSELSRTLDHVRGISIKAAKIPVQYRSIHSIEYDYALLRLTEKVERSQYLPLGVGYQYLKETITNIGYRADDVIYSDETANQKMEQESGGHSVKDNIRLQHHINTTPGNSGGPIIVEREGAPLIVAIHKGIRKHAQGKRLSTSKRTNYARIISEDVLSTLLNWQKQFFLQDFTSQITAFHLDASPNRTPITIPSGIQSFLQLVQPILNREELIRRLNDLSSQRGSHQNQCNILQKRVDEVINRIQQLTYEKQQLQVLLRLQQNNEKLLLEEIEILKNDIAEKRTQTEKLKQQRSTMETLSIESPVRSILTNTVTTIESSQKKDHSSSSMKFSQFSSKSQSKKKELGHFWDLSTPFVGRFTVLDRKVIFSNDDYDRYQITSSQPIPYYSIIRFKLRRYGGNRDICMGLLLEERKRRQNSGDSGEGNKGSVGYWSCLRNGTGTVKVDGQDEYSWCQDLFIPEDTVLVMETDLYDAKVVFYIEHTQKKFVYQLSQSYKQQPVYIFVSLASKGDVIQILL